MNWLYYPSLKNLHLSKAITILGKCLAIKKSLCECCLVEKIADVSRVELDTKSLCNNLY